MLDILKQYKKVYIDLHHHSCGYNAMHFLTVNAGSSSIKLDLFESATMQRKTSGILEGIGLSHTVMRSKSAEDAQYHTQPLDPIDFKEACGYLVKWVAEQISDESQGQALAAIGHRVVHGGPSYADTVAVTSEMVTDLRRIVSFDPLHLPVQLDLIEHLSTALPGVPQYAAFDTAFFKNLSTEAKLLPIPRKYQRVGVRRYGFHGLSYAFIMTEIEHRYGADAARGRLIVAHLGNGVSVTAVQNGQPVDTTMGFTPTGGLPMSTRSGDLDPGVVLWLAKQPGMDQASLSHLLNSESGLLGVSGLSADMKMLLEAEDHNPQAAEAAHLFCRQLKKTIGAYAAVMGGIDRLVFTGGMGENAPKIRARSTAGLEFLGISIDQSRNDAHADVISPDNSPVAVHVLPTDEALTIARELLQLQPKISHTNEA